VVLPTVNPDTLPPLELIVKVLLAYTVEKFTLLVFTVLPALELTTLKVVLFVEVSCDHPVGADDSLNIVLVDLGTTKYLDDIDVLSPENFTEATANDTDITSMIYI
jgi:hypothetical protein